MTNLNYFILNQIKSNPDGEPTVNRQSRLMSYRCYLRNLAMIFAVLVMSMANIGMAWGEASKSSGSNYATGTITFADFGNMSAETNYWYNGIKVYSGGVQSAKASNSTWSEKVSVPAYISDKPAGADANKGKWGSNGSGKQYTMSGLAFNTHAIGIHVNGKCTVTVVVDKNIGSDTDDAGITASVDATAYGTAWTDVTYKTAGTALEVTSTRADKTNYPGRYTLTIPITTDGEKVVKMFNSESGTGAGKLFCFESITVTPASSEHWYVYGNFSDGSTWGDTEVEMGGNVDISLPLDAHDYSFKIKHVMSDGETTYYSGNNGIMSRGECTNWDMNVDENCRIRTDISGTYNFALTLNKSTPRVTVTYPTGGVLVTLVLNNGGNSYSWYTRSGEPIIKPNFEPSKDGYAFDGWYADSECTEPWNWSTTVSSATTLYAKWSNAWYFVGAADWSAYHLMTRSAGGSYWYYACEKGASNNVFLVHYDSDNYGSCCTSAGYMCTNITNMNNSSNKWGQGDNAAIYENSNNYYVLVFPPYTAANTTSSPKICASTSLPEDYYSLPSGRTIYFDNSKAEWANIYFRKGRDKCAHNEATALTKVPGTDNLYKLTTNAVYDGYQAFHLANNCSWTGDNSIYKVNGAGYAITKATVFQKYTINEDVTFTPGDTYGSPSDGCQYYDVDKTSGMKTQNVSITAPSNGTITVNYVDVSGAAQAFSSGDRDLAHTCIITVTAEPAAGYAEPATISINGASHGNRDPYTITGTTVVAATFSPASYTVTLNTNGGTINADNVTSYTYGTGATLPTNVTRDGFTFDGWYDNSGLTGSPVTTISTTATGNKEYWAKWTEDAGSSKCITFNSTSAPSVSGVTIKEVAGKSGGSTYTKDGFFMSQSNDYITFDISALGNLTKATFTAKTNSTGKTIGYGYTDNTTTIGKVPGGSGTADKAFHEYEITGIPGNTTRFTIIRQGTGTTITEVCLFYTPDVCSNPVIDEGSTKSSFTGGTWAQNSGHTITITATGADSYEWYRNTAANDDGATKLSETSNTLDITDVTPGTYFFKAVAKSGACSSSTEWLWCGSMTITAATYALTYNCNGAESGCPSNTTASALPNPLPTGLTKDGYTFGGWYTDEELTVPAVAGAAISTNTTLYAKWTVDDGCGEEMITFVLGVKDATAGSVTPSTHLTNLVNETNIGIAAVTDRSKTDRSGKYATSSTSGYGVQFTFDIADGYTFQPTAITMQLATVATTDFTFLVTLTDEEGNTLTSNPLNSFTGDGVLTTVTFPAYTTVFAPGTVTMLVTATRAGGDGTYRIGKTITITGDVCPAATYTVTYKANGGTGSDVVDDAATTISDVPGTFTAPGAMHFMNWNTVAGGTGVTYEVGDAVKSDLTLYAQWRWQLNYDANAGGDAVSNMPEAELHNPGTYKLSAKVPTRTGYTFDCWNRNAAGTGDCFAAGASYTTGALNETLYAKWTVRASECITIAYFDASQGNSSNNKPDKAGKYLYGYTNSAKTEAYAYTLTTGSTNNKGQGSGASDYLRVDNGTTINIYADNTTTGGTPANFSNVTSVSVDFKMKNSSYYTSFDIYVGDTKIADNVSLSGDAQTAFTTFTYNNLEQLNGKISIVNKGSGSTNFNFYIDNIQICTSNLPACTTPVLPDLTNNKTVCEGGDAVAAWDATITNSGSLVSGETVAYSWVKKGGSTPVSSVATYQPTSVTEAMAGTYVVTATVSADGKASKSATKEVTLTVNEATEVTGITADKATVYPTNSVTLTATANITPDSWQWYTCDDAEGAGEAIINDATSANYTITPASAGTYYYKVKATGDCGTAEMVYTLTVTAASECEKYFWFVYADDATTNGVVNNRDGFFTGAPTGSSNSSTYKFTLDGKEYEAHKNTGSGSFSMSFTIPEGSTATMGINCKGSSSKPLYLTHSSGTPQKLVSNSSSNGSFAVEDITEGTWTLTSAGSWTLAALGVQVCKTSTCTDATPTIAAANTTVCVGSELSISSMGYETGATFQWQKLNSSTSTWDNISGATSATYTVAQATAADAGSYRVVVTKECARTSNTVTIAVPSAPVFADFTATRTVMATLALSITDVEASDATSYAWYKSADETYDAGTDTKVGTSKDLLLVSGGEAANAIYYLFCVASNACGTTTSTAITVNVTAFIEEDCATKGNEGAADFGFVNTKCSEETYSETACWKSGGRAYYLTYSAPTGKYLEVAKVTVAISKNSKCGYAYSTDNGTNWTYAELTDLSTTLTEKTIELSGKNVTDFRIGRNLQDGSSKDWGSTSGTFYLSKICFEYSNACTATTVMPSESSVNYEMGGEWTNPKFTLSVAGALTYSSSNEDIASVDESGKVTFNDKAGIVTITASYAGGTIAETEYCASSGSYTITVSCPDGAPKIVAADGTNMSGCNSSVTLNAKQQDGTTDFTGGRYQWFRNGEEIADATLKSYTATQTGVYTVEYTSAGGCTSLSINNATVTSDNVEPEVERLVPFQYYHVNKTYSDQMKDRHLFSVKGSAANGSTGRNFKLTMSRNGEAATDITTAASIFVTKSGDGQVDTVMIDLNKLSDKYNAGDKLVLTCKAIDCNGNASDVYKNTITIHVIDDTPTLALICSGTDIAAGTRKTSELTVGGDFLTGYNKADLCQQTGNTTFDANIEWGLYTDLKANYIVTPVNGYAVFNKLNYEPFDILLLTDYPKASKSDAAATVLDDMADLCDYRPMLSFKTHMVAKSPSKWAAKGFTTSPVVSKVDGRLNLNIVCYAHPMFASLKTGEDVYTDVGNTSAPLVYTMLTGVGHEGEKGMQGFELAAAENFITIGLTHYNATITKDSPNRGEVAWTPGPEDRMLVTVAERQANPEARFILFSLNCGAQSKLTEKGEDVVLACLNYLLGTAEGTIEPADCSFTFDNGEGNKKTPAEQAVNCPSCPAAGDYKWSNPANWGPDYRLLPGEFTAVRIKKPVEVDITNAHVMEARILEDGSITIPAGKALEVKSTIRRMEGSEIYPTDVNDIVIGSSAEGNGTLIFNNDEGDTKARVLMYSTAKADMETMSAATSTWQYIGTPHTDVANARSNYYGSWLYQYDTASESWVVIPNGGPLQTFRGYCVTHPSAPVVFDMSGTLAATTSADIDVPANKYVVTANSWVAPIDISKITDDDMEGITDKTIYFFNTGSDPDGNHTITPEATGDARWAVGTYVSVPIHAASYTGTDDHIPSMQGFYVVGGTSNGTLHLDYDRHVRGQGRGTIVSGRMHAPKRVQTGDNEPEVLKIIARGSRYDDRLIVLEREDFTRRYDSGWDGEAWGGSELSPMVYITNEAGVDEAVSAIPEYEGTVITFRAGEDSEYRFEFIYSEDAEPLYLFDTENNTYTQIMTGNAYYFTTSDKAPHSRFILTRKAPQITTGTELTSDGESAKARKLLIEDKMYILLNGMLYDATGKVVK